MSQSQIVSLLMMAAGLGLMAIAIVRHVRSRAARVTARVRSALVARLMMAAGLALLLVDRLDRNALPQVLARVQAAMWSAVPPGGRR